MSILEYVRDPRFKAFGLAWSTGEDMKPRWVTHQFIPTWIGYIEFTYGWENVELVGQNIKFDSYILSYIYGIVPGLLIDTVGMSKAVLGKTIVGHSLKDLAIHFGFEQKGTMLTNGKDELTQEEEDELATYCIHDVELTVGVFDRLSPEFPENQYPLLDATVRLFIDCPLELDVPLLEQTAVEESARRANIFNVLGIEKSVFASNVKFPKLLESRGFEVPMKESKKKKDANGDPLLIPALALGDVDFLDMLESPNDELRDLCEGRVAAKSTLLETRSKKLARIGATGPWAFDVGFSGADQTQRWSGGKQAGGNPQNFTRGSNLRKAVMAQVRHWLVVGDFAKVELCIVAYLSGDVTLIQMLRDGVDIYCDYATAFYDRIITKLDETERRFGKTEILGLGYGMGWEKNIVTVRIQTGETIDKDTSKRAIALYRTRYAGVPALWKALDNAIGMMTVPEVGERWLLNTPCKVGFEYVRLPSGLKIRYPNLRTQTDKKGRVQWVYDVYDKRRLTTRNLYGAKLLEGISQGIAGELCKEAASYFLNVLAMQVHDELGLAVIKPMAYIYEKKLKNVMSLSPSWFPELQLSAEVGTGANWLEAK